MATLSITNTFVSGTVITAAGHNTNFSDIVTWANGNIGHTNLSTLSGTVSWAVTTNSLSISSTNTGTEGSATFAHNGTLAAGKSAVKISSSSAQSAGDALLYVQATSASNGIPSLLINDVGAGGAALKVISTTKPSHPRPSMTTTQRNALTSVSAGDEIFNTTLVRAEMYDGTNWVDAGGRTGSIMEFLGSSVPGFALVCDGSAVSRTTYAALFARLSTTWGVGDGSTTFNLPDLRGRTTIGDGTGSGLTARTLGEQTIGGETLPSHTHSGTTGSGSAHNHGVTDPGHSHTQRGISGGGGVVLWPSLGVTSSIQDGGTVADSPTGISIQNEASHTHGFTTGATGTGSHGVMQPSAVVKKCVVI